MFGTLHDFRHPLDGLEYIPGGSAWQQGDYCKWCEQDLPLHTEISGRKFEEKQDTDIVPIYFS